MDLFMAASKQTIVVTPFDGFNQCVVVCEMIQYTQGIGSERAFVLTPYHDLHVLGRSSLLLLCRAAQSVPNITPMSNEEVALWLDILSDYLPGNDEAAKILTTEEINQARATLQAVSHRTQYGQLVKLSEKISVILGGSSGHVEHSDYIFTISDIILHPLSMEFVGFASSNDIITAVFDLESLERSKLQQIRLLDDIRIHVQDPAFEQHTYTGVCTKIEIKDNLLAMSVHSHAYGLRQSRINHLSTVAVSPLDLVYFVGRTSGLREEQLNIEGFERQTQTYRISVPVINLTVTEIVGFGDVTFTPPGYDLDDIRRITEIGGTNADIFVSSPLAYVNVEAETLYDAWRMGISRIEHALDVLLHVVRADTIFRGIADDLVLSSWQLDDLTPKPRLSSWICIEQLFSGGRIVMDTSRIELPQSLVIGSQQQLLLDQMPWYEMLTRRLLESWNQQIQNLFSALKWLRRSWDADDQEDKIIFANIALEFVASGEPSPPVIPEEFAKLVRRAAVDKFKVVYDGPDKDALIAKLNDKLSFALTNAPLRVQIEGLIQREKIPVTPEDMRIILAGRRIRNDLVHGRGANTTLSSTESRKMVNAIGMMATYKLRSLFQGGDQ